MLKGLVVSEDYGLTNRIKASLKECKNIEFNYFDDIKSAIDFATNNVIDIAVICVSLSVMNGDEVSEMLVDLNPDISFIFIFDEDDMDVAVDLFNFYDDSYILLKSALRSEELKNAVYNLTSSGLDEDELLEKQNKYKEKEAGYKNTMSEMSSILNSRIECFNEVVKIYTASIYYLYATESNDSFEKINSFIYSQLNDYIKLFLVNTFVFEKEIDSIIKKYNIPEDNKIYVIDNKINSEGAFLNRLFYIINFLSNLFSYANKNYNIKIVIEENETVVRLDIIANLDIADDKKEYFMFVMKNCSKSLSVLCDKFDYAEKDNKIQIRIFLKK